MPARTRHDSICNKIYVNINLCNSVLSYLFIILCDFTIFFLIFFEDLKLKITTDYGAEFVVPFFSGSQPLALKSSSNSHQ